MADQVAYSINEIRNLKAIDNGDGTVSLSTSSANMVDGVLPASLGRTTMEGSLPVTMASDQGSFPINIYDDQTSSESVVSPLGSVSVTDITRLIGGTFDGTSLDAQRWTTTLAAAGSVALSGGIATISTGGTANGRAFVNSTAVARFLSAMPNISAMGVRIPDSGVGGNIRRWGAFDANDGYFFELSGTELGIVYRKAGVDTRVTSFNGTAFTLDTNNHTYQICWTGAIAIFFVDRVRLHLLVTPTAPSVSTYSLKLGFETINSGGLASARTIEVRAAAINRFGQPTSRPSFYNVSSAETRVLKNRPGTLHRVTINTKGGGGATIVLYDNTAGSGTTIATIDTSAAPGGAFEYNLDFSIGLTYVTTGTANITVVFD